jgi:hypothetical protein
MKASRVPQAEKSVEFAVDERIDIDQACCEPTKWCLVTFGEFCDHFGFITPIMVNGRFRIPLEMRQQRMPHAFFVMDCSCPEGMIGLMSTLTDQQTEQIMEMLIGYAFAVQEEFDGLPEEFRQCMDVNFACPYRQRLEFDVKMHGLIF